MKTRGIHWPIAALIIFCEMATFGLHAQSRLADTVQSRFYIKASAGFGIGINGDFVENYDYNNNVTNTPSKFGTGIYYHAGFGYQYNSNLGSELDFGYLLGVKSNAFPPYSENSEHLKGTIWQLTPSVVFSASFGKFSPYLKTGLSIGIPEAFDDYVENNYYDIYNPDKIIETKTKFYNGLATGLQTTLGCSYQLNNKFSLFAEAMFDAISYKPENSSVYYYNVDGVDQLSFLSVADKEYVYKKSGTLFNNYGPDDQPTVTAQGKIPLSGIYLNIGIKWGLPNQFAPKASNPDLEHRFYARANLGYGFATNGDLFDNITLTQDTGYFSTALYSAGQGFNAGIGAGYMLTKNIGIDFGFNYLASAKYKAQGTGFYNPNMNSYLTVGIYESSQYGNMFQLNPSVVFSTHIQKFQPYSRLGLIVGFGTVYNDYDNNDSSSIFGNATFQQTVKYYGGIFIGYSTVIGIAYPLSDRLDVYTEACFNTIYDVPAFATVTKQVVNGVDNLNNLSTSLKEEVFKSSYNDNQSMHDPDKPSIASPVRFSFDALVASIGVRMWF